MSIIGSIVSVAVYVTFLNRQSHVVVTTAFSLTMLGYVILFFLARRWVNLEKKNDNYNKYSRILQFVLVALGCSWGLMVFSGVVFGDDLQRSLAYTLGVALISTSMVSGPARYALSFWVPITTICVFTIVFDVTHFYIQILIALVSYAFLSLYTILSVEAELQEREYSAFLVDAHAQTIDLLLKDFQDGSGGFLWESDFVGRIKGLPTLCNISNLIDSNKEIKIDSIFQYIEKTAKGRGGENLQKVRRDISARRSFRDLLITLNNNGLVRCWNIAGKPLFDEDGGFLGYRGLCTDVTDREEYRRRIEFAAKHDYLTDSLNRSTFLEFLDALVHSQTVSTSALLCIDLDNFKRVNDEFGHAVGDSLLKDVVRRIISCIRDEDRIFRLGGDEFAIAIPGGDRVEATTIAKRVIERVSMPFRYGQTTIQVGASIGIALIEAGGTSGDIVHKQADLALYRAKAEGKSTFCFADDDLNTEHQRILAMEQELAHALDYGQLSLVYQPIIDLRSYTIVAAEVLLRWTHPTFGAVPPDVFIPLLEQSGRIADVGIFVIREAIRAAANIPASVRLAINLSPIQLAEHNLPHVIAVALDANNVSPQQIDFEITESRLLDGDVDKQGVLAAIREMGCRICLDDFGTGHSSLRLLEEFPFEKIKIDGSFISRDRANTRQRQILEAMIQLGRSLDIPVTGEGVETQEQATELATLGCIEGQGFFFFSPMDLGHLLQAIEQSHLEAGVSQ